MKYVIDIDGTICDKPKDSDYAASVPKLSRIEMVNELYNQGHTIVYFTARGMGRNDNNAQSARKQFYDTTERQLRSWGCKYHQLILGKPSGDIYIDDKGINCNDFFGE